MRLTVTKAKGNELKEVLESELTVLLEIELILDLTEEYASLMVELQRQQDGYTYTHIEDTM